MSRLTVFISIALLGVLGPMAEVPDLSAQDEYVESGRQSLQSDIQFPWYDRDHDTTRPINLKPSSADRSTHRDSEWTAKPKQAANPQKNTTPGGSVFNMLAMLFFWSLVGLLLAGLAIGLVWAFLNQENRNVSSTEIQRATHAKSEAERIENLPFQVEQPVTDFLSAARQHQEQGDLRSAIIFLFSYMLVELDRHQWIHLSKGTTNRQYLRKLRRQPGLYEPVEQTMVAFEDVFFGNLILSQPEFQRCWDGLSQFQQHVTQTH